MVVNASAVELLDVESYVAETVGARPLLLWNLELDSLRADLGASLSHLPLGPRRTESTLEAFRPCRNPYIAKMFSKKQNP